MKTKLDALKAAWNSGNKEKALAIAARFPVLGSEKEVITRGHECRTNPRFYTQLGYDTELCFRQALEAMAKKYSLS